MRRPPVEESAERGRRETRVAWLRDPWLGEFPTRRPRRNRARERRIEQEIVAVLAMAKEDERMREPFVLVRFGTRRLAGPRAQLVPVGADADTRSRTSSSLGRMTPAELPTVVIFSFMAALLEANYDARYIAGR